VTDTNVFQLSQPGAFADPLTEVLRNGARALLTQAVEAEVAALLSSHADKLTEDGRQRLVRHGYFEREIMTGIGPVAVRCPRVRDRDQLERVNRPVLASRLNHVEMCEQEDRLAASVIGSGILETAIRLQLVSATVRQLPRGELAGRAFKTLDHDEASDFASEEGVQELGIIAQ
jgi:Transposase, Mutator family